MVQCVRPGEGLPPGLYSTKKPTLHCFHHTMGFIRVGPSRNTWDMCDKYSDAFGSRVSNLSRPNVNCSEEKFVS